MQVIGLMAFVAFHLVTAEHGGDGYIERGLLIDKLLASGHNKDVLPICEDDSAVNVTLGLKLRQIIQLSDKERRLQTRVWINLCWTDCRLTWNSSEFNIKRLHIPYDRVWTPDLTLYEDRLTDTSLSTQENYPLSVQHDGSVTLSFPASTDTACDIDVTHFPFDVHDCPLEFGSWVYDDSLLSFTFSNIDDPCNYVESGEWDFCLREPKTTIDNTETGSYSSLVYSVAMRRQPDSFLILFFAPSVVISACSIFVFCLPPSKEKIGLQATILVSLTVFQTMTLETIPPDSKHYPFICVYFMLLVIFVGISCVGTIIMAKLLDKAEIGRTVRNCNLCDLCCKGENTPSIQMGIRSQTESPDDSKPNDRTPLKTNETTHGESGFGSNHAAVTTQTTQDKGHKISDKAECKWINWASYLDVVFAIIITLFLLASIVVFFVKGRRDWDGFQSCNCKRD